ncbi:MAG: polysaccharide deacetylase family protein, partial [Bacteroidota bacterium]
EYSRKLGMNWDEIREMAQDDLVTIGAHTVNHFPLTRLEKRGLDLEVIISKEILEDKIKRSVSHFAYPFGKPPEASIREFEAVRRAGFKTAVTTRIGNIFEQHAGLLECLPRISINRATQRSVLKLQTSGLLPFVYNRGRRIISD